MTTATASADAIDHRDAVPGLLVRGGGFLFMASGLLVAGTGLQHLVLLDGLSWLDTGVSALLLLLGMVGAMVGPNVMLGRSWAAALGVAVALASALVMVPFGIYSTFFLYVLSPLTWIAMALSVLSCLAVPATLPGALKATRARNALYR